LILIDGYVELSAGF